MSKPLNHQQITEKAYALYRDILIRDGLIEAGNMGPE